MFWILNLDRSNFFESIWSFSVFTIVLKPKLTKWEFSKVLIKTIEFFNNHPRILSIFRFSDIIKSFKFNRKKNLKLHDNSLSSMLLLKNSIILIKIVPRCHLVNFGFRAPMSLDRIIFSVTFKRNHIVYINIIIQNLKYFILIIGDWYTKLYVWYDMMRCISYICKNVKGQISITSYNYK